jgi:hypothetical protein
MVLLITAGATGFTDMRGSIRKDFPTAAKYTALADIALH